MKNQLQPGQITREMYFKLIIVYIVMTVALPLMLLAGPYYRSMSARSLGRPEECTAINIRSITEVRNSRYVTTFLKEDGSKIEIDASCKDYVGRKMVLLVYGRQGSRQNYEFPKLTMLHIIMIILLVFCWLSILYFRITKKLVVIKDE